jgi:multiple sugar transport system substrate-binding protein
VKEIDRQQRLWIAKQADKAARGVINRREFIRRAALAGFGLSSMRYLSACAPSAVASSRPHAAAILASASAPAATNDAHHFLKQVGSKFAGTTIRLVSEATPSSRAIHRLMHEEFIPLTGINVEWEQLPLDQVLAKISHDSAGQLGANDIYYLDRAWLGCFAQDLISPAELLDKSDLAYPSYNFDDFLPQLVETVCTSRGVVASFPYDIPIFIMMYRKDIFDQLKLRPPTTMAEYLNAIKTIHAAGITAPDGSGRVAGTTLQWKPGHYGLACNWMAWHWAHGASIFGADEQPTLNDEAGLAAANYMLELGKYAPAGVANWDWSGEAASFAQGRAGIYISWSEFFPNFDDPVASQVVGMVEAAPCPRETALRHRSQCGFAESPGISRQSGFSLGLSRYSKNVDAAWVFLQWATSADIMTRASILGGGVTPTRKSSFSDPRTQAYNKVVAGATRHFAVTLDAIENRMGAEPHLPVWSSLSVDIFAQELGKMTAGGQDAKTTLDNMAQGARDATARMKSNLL